jgi:hypothetical protein
MPSIRHFQDAVTQLIDAVCPDLGVRTRRRLVFILLGVMLAGSVVMRRVACTAAQVWEPSTTAPSHERRLRRILADPAITWEQTHARLVRRILQRPRRGRWQVILDESGHTDHTRTLVAALWYRGRAIPLAWVMWPAQTPQTVAYWARCAQVLTLVAALLPDGVPAVVVGDRAFGCPAFTDLVAARGWDWLVRIQGQTCFQDADGVEQGSRDRLGQPGGRICQRGWLFKKAGWRPASLVGYWRRGCVDPLLLASSLPATWGLVRQYRTRSAIEAMFRDWKSSGWNWEASQARTTVAQEQVILLLAMTTLVTLCLGAEAATHVLAQPPQTGQRRPWAARESLFQVGRHRMWTRIWQGITTPIAWVLHPSDAPNWSQECWEAARPDATPLHMTGRCGRRETRRAA